MWFSKKLMSKHINQQNETHQEKKTSDMNSSMQQTMCIKQKCHSMLDPSIMPSHF